MSTVFVDANIVVDFMNESAKDHKEAYEAIRIIRFHFGKPAVSPFTFIIANYFFGKVVRDKRKHREKMQFVFSGFIMTPVADSFLRPVFDGRFTDLEDASQYQCALHVKANLILTKNVHDFFPSTIPVIHPQDFVNRYNNIIS